MKLSSWKRKPQAAWRKFVSSEDEHKFVDLTNVHISSHQTIRKNQPINIFNISNHVRFQVRITDDVTYFHVLDPDAEDEEVYTATRLRDLRRQRAYKKASPQQAAHIFIGWKPTLDQQLQHQDNLEQRMVKTHQINELLHQQKPRLEDHSRSLRTLHITGPGTGVLTLGANSYDALYDLFVINERVVSISAHFINRHRFHDVVTFKANYDIDNQRITAIIQ